MRYFLVASLILFVGCKGAPKFPDVPVYETAQDPQSLAPLCGEYKIQNLRDLKFTPVLDHPLRECYGVFGFKVEHFPAILDWMDKSEKYWKDKLEKCEARR